MTQKVFQSNPCKEIENTATISVLAKQNGIEWRNKYIGTSLKEREYIENRIDEITVEDFISSDPERGNSISDLAYYLKVQGANYAVANNFITPSVARYIFPPDKEFPPNTITPLLILEPRIKSWKDQ